MKALAIVGKVDNRVIVYPLARALSLAGQVAIVTDDGAYRRLYQGYDDIGTVSGVDIIIGDKIDEKLQSRIKETGINYDYILYVSAGYIPANVDGIVLCMGFDKSMYSKESITKKSNTAWEEIEGTDGIEIEDMNKVSKVYIAFDKTPKDGSYLIRLKDFAIKYVYYCEDRKELLPVDDKEFNKTLAKIVGDKIGISSDEIYKLLTRVEYTNSSKVK